MKNVFLFLGIFLCFSLAAQENRSYSHLNMASSPFVVEDNYLSKHDIVYLSPTQLEAEGFPMGNGDMGGMIWNHENGIELQVNKNDLWTSLMPEEENASVLKHAARLKIDFGLPVFSWIHLKDFEGRLSLKNGEAGYRADTPFSRTCIKTWLAHGKNVWVIECENLPDAAGTEGNSVATITLERLGSRAFARWYSGGFPKDPAVGIGETEAGKRGNDMVIEEKGNGLHFAVACRIVQGDMAPALLNTHTVEQKTDKDCFTVLLSVATDRESANPVVEQAVKLLDEAESTGLEQLKKEKDEWYSAFWSNSFMKLGDDYLENIYYLRRYLMAAGSQGEFPVTFNGGLWRWNRDVMNWITPHHWNTQQQYWGLCAQNDCQLMVPYLDTYFKMIPAAQALAKEKGASNDALQITEAHCFTGEQLSTDWESMKNNFTPASQIASLFWDYYEFTDDEDFLREKAYPFMKKAANFYLDKLQWDERKKEYYFLSSLYESEAIEYVKNSMSDRNCIEQLLGNCIKAATILKADKDLVKRWNYVLNHLWKRGYEQLEGAGEVLSPAEEYYSEARYTPWIWANGGLVAFPAGLIGIDDKDTRIGKAVINLARWKKDANAHYPIPEVAARMGLGDEALEYVMNGVKIHQMYPQGLMHNVTGYPDNIYDLASKHDLLGGKYVIRSHDFFQCGMEAMSNYATTMNEMMLQSNEGKIRVFPAVPSAWNSTRLAFTLLARGAFIVSAERNEQARVGQIGIKSLKGNRCFLQNPWGDEAKIEVIQVDNGAKMKYRKSDDNVICFLTKPGKEYIVRLADDVRKERTVFTGSPNKQVKKLGNRMLGKLSGWNDFH